METKDDMWQGSLPEGASRTTMPMKANPLAKGLSLSRTNFSKSTLAEPSRPKAVDGSLLRRDQLPLLRAPDTVSNRLVQLADADTVKTLSTLEIGAGSEASSKRMSGVRQMEERRKARHDDAVKEFDLARRHLYESCEHSTVLLGRELTSRLAAIDKQESAHLAHVADPAMGLDKDHAWLAVQHAALEAMESARSAAIEAFAAALNGIESRRAASVETGLQRLATTAVAIGCLLTPDVERMVGEYSTEVNLVVADNRKEHADVVARLETAAVASRRSAASRWLEVKAGWRLLKHNDATTRFKSLLGSDVFVNPAARVAAFADLFERRSHAHKATRLRIIGDALALRPPALCTPAVDSLRSSLAQAEADDFAVTAASLGRIQSAQEATIVAARERNEALRIELHEYAALSPESGLRGCATSLYELVASPGLEDFFRRVHGLKVELDACTSAAQGKDVLFAGPLFALRERVALIVDARELGPAADAVGRGAERTAIVGVLDSMRSLKRTEIPAALVRLHRLGSSLCRVPGLPASVTAALSGLLDEVADAIDDTHEALVAGGIEVPAAIAKFLFPDETGGSVLGSVVGSPTHRRGSQSRERRRSRSRSPTKVGGLAGTAAMGSPDNGSVIRGMGSVTGSVFRGGSAMGSVAGGGRNSPGSVKSGVSRRSASKTARTSHTRGERSSMASMMTDPLSMVMGNILPLPAIRGLQRRFAVLMASSDLPVPAHELLVALLAACDVQGAANAAVDGVLAVNATPCVESREREGRQLLERVGAAIDAQQSRLSDAGQRIMAWVGELATSSEAHAEAQVTADDGIREALHGCTDDDADRREHLQFAFEAAEKRLREAPFLTVLESRFKEALLALAGFDTHYRVHAKTTVEWARLHVDRGASVLRAHRAALCRAFGLSLPTPTAELVDGVSVPGEEVPDSLEWTLSGPVKADPASCTNSAASKTRPLGTAPGEPSVLNSLKDLVKAAGKELEPASGSADATLPLPRIDLVAPTLTGATLESLNLGNTVVRAPVPPNARPAVAGEASPSYSVSLTSGLLAEFFADADALAARCNSVRAAEAAAGAEAAAQVAAEATAAEAAAAAKGGKPAPAAKPAPAGKPKSKAEQEAEAKEAAEEAERATLAAERAEAEVREAAMLAADEARATAAANAAFRGGIFDAATGLPLDPAGNAVVPGLPIERTTLAGWLEGMRSALLTEFEQYASERRTVLATLASSRIAATTAELDDRLRRHWPRTGELEVGVRAVREAQLVNHRSRLDRHGRHALELEDDAEAAFTASVAEAEGAIAATLARLAALQAALPEQTSLAAIQGLASKARQLNTSFVAECEERCSGLRARTEASTAKLLASGADFLSNCALFSSNALGAEYDEEEVAAFAKEVASIAAALATGRETRMTRVGALDAAGKGSLEKWAEFGKAFDAALKELSMREGLGPKYGAPRRGAMEAIRTIVRASETEADAIDARLTELVALLEDSEPGAVPPPCTASPATDEEIEIIKASKGLHNDAGAPHAEGGAAVAGAKPGTAKAPAAAAAKPASAAAAPAAGKARQGDTLGAFRGNADTYEDATRGMSEAGVRIAEHGRLREINEAHLAAVGPAPLSVRFRRVTALLRNALFTRAVHLRALKSIPDRQGPLRTFNLPFLSLADAPCVPSGKQSTESLPLTKLLFAPHTYPPSSTKDAFVLPIGSSTAPEVPKSVLAVPLDQAIATSLDPLAPHTVKGPSPSPAHTASIARPPLVEAIAAALDKCKADTVALYAAEGIKMTDSTIPDSVKRWIADQVARSLDLREFFARRFREQVEHVTAVLTDVPSVLVADITARNAVDGEAAAGRAMAEFRVVAQGLETRRLANVDALRLRLADPNSAPALATLVEAEAARCRELSEAIATARLSVLSARAAFARIAAARLLHGVVLFCCAVEECVVRDDLAPMPGDEVVPPTKMSFRRLHRTLRKAGAEAEALAAIVLGDVSAATVDSGAGGGGAATAPPAGGKAPGKGVAAPVDPGAGGILAGHLAAKSAFMVRAWPGLPHPDVVFGAPPGAAAAAPAPPPAAAATPGKGGASVPPTPAAMPVTPAPAVDVTLGAFSCVYGLSSRHAVRARDAAYTALVQSHADAASGVEAEFAGAEAAVVAWTAAWRANVTQLTGGALTAAAGTEGQ